MKKKNYLSEAKNICVQGIVEHKTFPEHMKQVAISLITEHFALLGKSIAAIELTYLRSKDKKENV